MKLGKSSAASAGSSRKCSCKREQPKPSSPSPSAPEQKWAEMSRALAGAERNIRSATARRLNLPGLSQQVIYLQRSSPRRRYRPQNKKPALSEASSLNTGLQKWIFGSLKS
jgi:ActR/RegA family two-component response regulator